MRQALIILGIVAVVAGAAILSGKIEYDRKQEVMHIGGMSAQMHTRESVPQWIGGFGLGLGLGLVIAGILRK
jgi:hypothetical protein